MNQLGKTGFLWNTVFAFTLLVYAVGLFVTVMEPDAAVYALTSMEMHHSGNYLEIFLKGNDWLDKPHFQFWVTAFSYSIFGVNTIAYKLPAVLFSLIAVLYTYFFGSRYYSKRHGFLAALILMTAQHIITSNMDVRAEPYMTGLTIMALFHFAVYLDGKKFLHLLAGCVGACMPGYDKRIIHHHTRCGGSERSIALSTSLAGNFSLAMARCITADNYFYCSCFVWLLYPV